MIPWKVLRSGVLVRRRSRQNFQYHRTVLSSWHSRILTYIIGHVLKKRETQLRVYRHFCVMYTYVIAHAGLILSMRCPCSVVGVKTRQRDCATEASLLAQLNSGARLHGCSPFPDNPFPFLNLPLLCPNSAASIPAFLPQPPLFVLSSLPIAPVPTYPRLASLSRLK